ncbi:MAG: hypothetical protein SFW62_03205 [Alphaproteobacteria bacterium]|nr:hypothetical protein [Alphaproteobacteria bacterium]
MKQFIAGAVNTGAQSIVTALGVNADATFRATQANIDATKRASQLQAIAATGAVTGPMVPTLSIGCATVKAQQARSKMGGAARALRNALVQSAISKDTGPSADATSPAAAAKNVCGLMGANYNFIGSSRYGQLGASLQCRN